MNRKFITGIVAGNALVLMGLAGAVLGINAKSTTLSMVKENSLEEQQKKQLENVWHVNDSKLTCLMKV
jgi:hypothetical protein